MSNIDCHCLMSGFDTWFLALLKQKEEKYITNTMIATPTFSDTFSHTEIKH